MDDGHLERVLADDYVGDVAALALDDLRARRAECQALEVTLSYQRRVAQGRLDLVAAEQRRRAEGAPAGSSDDLVRSLAAALADRQRPAGNGRLPQMLAPESDEIATPELDAIAGPGVLGHLDERTDAELADLVEALSGHEAGVSRRRRSLHERIDALQAEITRRYRTGEASVESLLK